jgi:hypothetical protein
MAGRGAAPASTRASKKQKAPMEMVKADGKLRGFPLPDDALYDEDTDTYEDWHPMTQKWWDAWRASPQAAKMMSEPDWYTLLDTALIHHRMWQNGKWEFASEVRLRVAKFGATPEDRARLRMEIEVPEEFPVGNKGGNKVTSLDSRRQRLVNG